ncbi:putative post-transcriptional gene silencing PAZ-Argonaute family [Helianthus annuus]|uniref:Post-transcriptional gene silencing PAZ-Argonaute family n=1 Tax=Helianthus annuus TaxID=4232 RepID=A0A251S2R7_HELAN|nr:protein argonaute 2 [Helianthus annuus]KAF5762029.1 putative post-transcriptional gene silencing PAZ-Argonaute family [Helianthus annuus]KAJ0823122.1 putative post-transcriptional gene silencing PAZ-Argonaute family protein [Helianthus annuus]
MERNNNYNRVGGGRSNGGRGGGGRGGGGGYHHGGRNGNYSQQYGNQQQEYYGGGGGRGRGRDRDSGGRGQQSQRTPANSRQHADRVPEVDAWSRVASGQPVVAQRQTLAPNRNDRQVQEINAKLSTLSVTEHSKDGVANALVPIKRPDHGTLAMRSVKLLVNHFSIKFDPSNTILRYDVDIQQAVEQEGSSSTRVLKKKKRIPLRQIQEKLCSEYPDRFPLLQTAYDGEKNIFSAVSLQAGTYSVQLDGRSYVCTIKFGNELNLSKLQDFLNRNAVHVPRDVLQALDVVMKANLFREKVSVGRGMYPRVHRREDDLRCGVAAYRGSQQSLKVTSNGLIMCTDYSVMPFRKRIPVLDFLKEHLRVNVHDIPSARYWVKVVAALTGLKVTVTHRRTKQKYTVFGLSEKPTKDISFVQEDLEGKKAPQVVMLTDYFREKWDKEIVHKGIPCLQLGTVKRPNYVPMEFCVLAEDRRFPKEQLSKEVARRLKDLSLLAPDKRMNETCGIVREEYAIGKPGAEVIQNFGIGVSMNMTEVDGRVMEPPKLKLGSSNGKPNIITVDKQKCHYNLLQGRTLVTGKSVERWALIDFSSMHDELWLDIDSFIPKLMKRCGNLGVRMKEPLRVYQTNMQELNNVNTVRELLKWLVEECRKIDNGRLQLIVCVMPERHDGYKSLKLVSEIELGVMTQCCLSENANKGSDQFLANLGLKINAKLDGCNVQLVERFPRFSSDDRYMFIGADVNHPAASNTESPSVAAIVGSVDPAATRYVPRVFPQEHRKEEIVNFGSVCLDLVNTYAKFNGVKPNKIVVFRDGVSDDQFEMVLNKEMVDMKKAIYTEHYRPFVTFVVAQKRHTTRLFLNNENDIGNVPPGTVVDTNIVHTSNFDFYLCSHFGGMGTSKATHYSVIWDEIGFSANEIQRLTYDLCFVFARCTKPVSLVTPVYYADLLAYRGRMFQEEVMQMEASGSAPPSSSFDQAFYNLDQHLKDSMFFI